MFLFISGVSCGNLTNGINTEPVPFNTNLLFGDHYLYSCLPGYKSDGNMITECLAYGNYSIEPPTCAGKYHGFSLL